MLDKDRVEALAFDAYGTLLDIFSVDRACADVTGDPKAFVTLWRAKQLEYTFQRSLMDRYVDFWQVTADALEYTVARLGLDLSMAAREQLLQAWLDLAPFPEVAEALRRLAGRPLAVLSNGSPRMLETVLDRSGLRPLLTHVLSVDDVRVYKPSPRVYELAPRHLGVGPEAIVFVSGNPWDAAGAASFGFRVAWLNRAGLPFDRLGQAPNVEVRDLAELAEMLGARVGGEGSVT
jgi:2-haloacid dehalogenase